MLFGLDGVEIGLIIVFLCLFGGIISGFPVAFAIAGAAIMSFAIIAALDSAGVLVHQSIDEGSAAYRDLLAAGESPLDISKFRYPDLPRITESLFPGGWELAVDRNVSFIVNRINERVLAGQSIETLLAVLMFVLMGITLERSRIADDLLHDHGADLRAAARRACRVGRGGGRIPGRLDRHRRGDRRHHGPSVAAHDAAPRLLAAAGHRRHRRLGHAWGRSFRPRSSSCFWARWRATSTRRRRRRGRRRRAAPTR